MNLITLLKNVLNTEKFGDQNKHTHLTMHPVTESELFFLEFQEKIVYSFLLI